MKKMSMSSRKVFIIKFEKKIGTLDFTLIIHNFKRHFSSK